MSLHNDAFLSQETVEQLTGIKRSSPRRQLNFLRRQNIFCFLNEDRRLIVTQSWLDNAGQAAAAEEPDYSDSELHGPKLYAVRR